MNMIRFECPWCDRSFSCGKGLGGHKRVHKNFKRENDHHQTMELVQITNGENPCPVCRQSFSSEKSLHGHMRKHPDRSWRGMRPPAPVPVDDDCVSVARNLLALSNNQLEAHIRFACDICGKQFRSYQALGGHKSHHGLKSTATRVYMEQPEGFVDRGEGGKGKKSRLLALDLNELPPESW